MANPFNPAIPGNQIKRYVHQPLTFDHFGVKVQIKENGRVILTAVDKESSTPDEVVFDEIDIPASLIFKVAQALKVTRNVEYVAVEEKKA